MTSYEKLINGQQWRREDGMGVFRTTSGNWLIEVQFDVQCRHWVAYFRHSGDYFGELSICRESDIPAFYDDNMKIEAALERAIDFFIAIKALWSYLDD